MNFMKYTHTELLIIYCEHESFILHSLARSLVLFKEREFILCHVVKVLALLTLFQVD
jgi:hypothetical protein